ncbi:MAG: radical SAM protein [Gammaproteobacteria bacterium]|nr:MAG: radical SAM protein [Gammaproteobacteria bacterium]
MILQKNSTIGIVELPELGLFDPNGKNLLADRRGTALISKQVLLANLQSAGFDAQLINLRKGEHQEAFGKVTWNDTELTKTYLGQKINDIDPSAYEAWGVTNNFSQHRDIARMTIRHLASKGRPVVVGGSDAIAAPQVYFAAGAVAVVLDKSGAANGPIMDYVLGKTPREELSGVMLANSSQQPSPRAKRFLSPEEWALPELSVVQQCLGTTYKDLRLPKEGALIGSVFADIGCDRKCDFCQTPNYRLGYRAMSPDRTLQWFKAQKDAGAWGVINSSDQFLGRILKKGGREDILKIMKGIREMELAVFYPNGLELKKTTLGRGINRKEGLNLTPDEELIEALWGWDGKTGCYLAYIPAERPVFGRQNYAKLLPWREHCEIMKTIVRAGLPHIIYGCIIGFPDDSDETLLHLEEAIVTLYEELLTINPSLNFQVLPVSIFPIPGTPQASLIYKSGLLRFDDPTIFGGVWTPSVDTNYLSYKEVVKWQRHLMQIGSSYMQHQ